jgi:hypothetical protein
LAAFCTLARFCICTVPESPCCTQDGKRLWRKARGLSLEPTPSMLPVLGKGDVLGDFQHQHSGKLPEDG